MVTVETKMTITTSQLFFLVFTAILFSSAHFSAQSSNEDEEDVKKSHFPDGFLFGTSTSSYQVEGAYLEDGKGASNWDVFCHVPGNIMNNENGDVADDHYHRYLEDLKIVQSLGVNAYRFSISWARILPRGRFGEINPRGIKFYNEIIDNLLLRGIQPYVTIQHHDIPQELEVRYGGWLNPLIQKDFVYFAEICFEKFGDRVKYWATINEPGLFVNRAYIWGTYPPGHCSKPFGNCSSGNSDIEPLIAMHNMLLSHSMAVHLYRKQYQMKHGGFIGIVVNALMYEPLTDEELDRQAVNRALAFNLYWILDPLVFGDYPPEMRHILGSELPRFSPRERKLITGSLDFIGINHYSTLYAKDCTHSACTDGEDRPIQGFVNTTGYRDGVAIGGLTGMPRFFVVPEGMEKIIDHVKKRYNNKPMFVTENGFTPPEKQSEQVQDLLEDIDRIKFHKAYLAALARAIRNGADVRGYFIWSLMDNFEWVHGYKKRFGLYYVDRQTLNRTPKLSARWFTSFLTNNSHSNKDEFWGDSFRNKDMLKRSGDKKADI
ncbi:beta-glucosidase 18-like [Quercus robur]|uniref:beta-glucosidase 18-like n=1 Tax=Quercus robur TaxID=38942 RepID=UPI002163808A|nr:beta-glucosidase 18-like [Quercus robur]